MLRRSKTFTIVALLLTRLLFVLFLTSFLTLASSPSSSGEIARMAATDFTGLILVGLFFGRSSTEAKVSFANGNIGLMEGGLDFGRKRLAWPFSLIV